MAHVNGDGAPGGFLPMGGKSGVQRFEQLARNVVADIEQAILGSGRRGQAERKRNRKQGVFHREVSSFRALGWGV
jgi:hypothetical protein